MKLIEILNDIEFKGNKTRTIIKIIVVFASTAIISAFIIGQLKSDVYHEIKITKTIAKENKEETKKLRKDINIGFEKIDKKIDQIYMDGIESFEEYRIFNNKQLELIIEFNQSNQSTNQELLKKMLKLNSDEKAQQIKNQVNLPDNDNNFNLPSIGSIKSMKTNKIKYYVDGAPENYLDTLDLNKYKILEKGVSENYVGLYQFIYVEK